ncbi:3,4-dihydroxyphenylacetaldehyde synthase 2-like isoform X2 [Gordionus sp. m RMFG-2023]|uniref:3,4-dihydroxyphenylacetaldehyde synthase 2-like isoform X2 n=1 Tax=Gordionus sp. m RMFG-2023 TaxID=3053472 RepID=UPI0031FCDB1D
MAQEKKMSNRLEFLDKSFVENGLTLLKFVMEYHNNIRKFSVRPTPALKPGYLRNILPSKANDQPVDFANLYSDIINIILPGIVHWQSPKFHGFFPAGCSYPSLYADIISAAFSCIGFNWTASPIYTELEIVMVDWMAKEMGLPKKFLFESKSGGGGIIQGSASEGVTVSIIAAREKKISEILEDSSQNLTYYEILSKLRAYTSDQTHSSVIKSARMSAVTMTIIESESDLKLGEARLLEHIKRDTDQGLIPFFVAVNIGTTNTCAFDDVEIIGKICQDRKIWLHIDAAYGGVLFFLEEYRKILPKIDLTQSLTFNPHKLMDVCYDCSILWIEDGNLLKSALGINPAYLKNDVEAIVEFKDWQIGLGRRFRSLKIYFHIKLLGMEHIRSQIRNNIRLGEYFESVVLKDRRLFIPYPLACGMLCFNLKDSDLLTRILFKKLIEQDIYLTSTEVKGRLLIRFPVGCSKVDKVDLDDSWKLISEVLDNVLDGRES